MYSITVGKGLTCFLASTGILCFHQNLEMHPRQFFQFYYGRYAALLVYVLALKLLKGIPLFGCLSTRSIQVSLYKENLL